MRVDISDADERARRESVVLEFGGILPHQEVFYIESVRYSAQSAAAAFDRFSNGVLTGSQDDLALFVQEALTHAAALSRYFWPARSRGVHSARAKRLRCAFNVSDTSPLKDRELRNSLEHFDERLDEFLLNDPVGCIMPGTLIAPHTSVDGHLGIVFRLVDPVELVFVIFGRKHAFRPVVSEAKRLASLAREMLIHGGRLPAPDRKA